MRNTSLLWIPVIVFSLSCEKKSTEAERDAYYERLSNEERRLPENALAGLEVAEGLDVSLFASEPMLVNPTNMDIDAKGRVWVCEAMNYRPHLNPNNPQRSEGDRILILEDIDGDGKADTAKVFYQGNDINSALGIAVLGNKVIVSCSPNVFIFTDTNGDDVADQKEVLFTGLSGVQHDHGIHAFVFGPDGKLYFNFGNTGKQLFDKKGNPVTDKAGNLVHSNGSPYRQGLVLRSDLDGSSVEVLGHNFRNNYELAVDSYGTIWQSDNDDDGNQSVRINYVMEYGNYGYSEELTGGWWQSYRMNMEESIPDRHWHQNDPGSIPNLLVTGAGSPTGILVYEGDLLPKVFRNQMIHADAGPNIIRSYPVVSDGAGYSADIINIFKGKRDQWFRPSDICVAPDGSLFIADWYDPGVGGHQMGDMERGRIYRVTPKSYWGSIAKKYKAPEQDFTSAAGAARALKSPNMATRYLAWQKLYELQAQAEEELLKLYNQNDLPHLRARALWLLAKIEGRSDYYIKKAIADKDPNIRITGVRVARQSGQDIFNYLKALQNDENPQVRREVLIALRHYDNSAEAAELWASLAMQYDGKDRWYLEALGLAADKKWDKFLAAWIRKAGDPVKDEAGQNIIWRSRTSLSLPLLADIIQDQKISEDHLPKFFRTFDFIEDPSKEEVLLSLLKDTGSDKEHLNLLVLSQLKAETVNSSPKAQQALTAILQKVKGTEDFINLISKYRLHQYSDDLLQTALEHSENTVGVQSARLLMELSGTELLKRALISNDKNQSAKALAVLSRIDNSTSISLIMDRITDSKTNVENKKEAIMALGAGWNGSKRLMNLVLEDVLSKDLNDAALRMLTTVSRRDVREEAIKLRGQQGSEYSSVEALLKIEGNISNGTKMFSLYCSACHKVGSEGADFGPALTKIGSKLSKEALFTSIIEPDAGISFGYEGFIFKLKDGSERAGIIHNETAAILEIKNPGGAISKIDKSHIASREQMKTSMMPQLNHALNEQELADIVSYLSSLK